jgi:predicted PurR-regulated permease PerM
MKLEEKDFRILALIILLLVLIILVFLIIRPVLLSIIGGLLLAYAFHPIYKYSLKFVKYPGIAAAFVSIFAVLIIALPLWFLAPIVIQQVFDLFQLSQGLDIHGFISSIFPSGTEQAVEQISLTINNALSTITSGIVNSMVSLLLDFPRLALQFLLVAFVFFFALWDSERLKEFVSGLSPLNKNQEGKLVKQFKDITNSIIYGQVVVGLLQGILAGIGFLIFGVSNAFLLTILALIVSVIPVIGPSLIYIPITFYLLATGDPIIAFGFLAYNIFVVSTVDNILRAHIVSRKTKLSQVIILIGMIGGLLVFGILGIILGPLILACFVTFLKAYKENTLSSMFTS